MYCKSCEQEKPLDGFPRNRSKLSGRGFYCNECMYDRTKKWRKENPDKLARIQKNRNERLKSNNAVFVYGNPKFDSVNFGVISLTSNIDKD